MDLIRIFSAVTQFAYVYDLNLLAVLLIPIAIYAILFIFEGIGLYTMAEKQGVSGKWQAFVPFANSYLMARLSGECAFFGKKIKKLQNWILIFELVAFLLGLTYFTTNFLMYQTSLFNDYKVEFYNEALNITTTTINPDGLTGSLLAVYRINDIFYYLYSIGDLVYMIFFIVTLVNFFRRYYARNYMIFVLVSIFFPVEGIFAFAVRNNKPINYQAYVNQQRARYYNQAGGYSNPYNYYSNGTRNTGNSQNTNTNGGGYGAPTGYNYDPFTGKPVQHSQSEKKESPFPEFDDDSSQSKNNSDKNNNNSDNNPFEF